MLEYRPGEEAQVDYGQGALTRTAERQVPAAVPVRDDAQVLGQELSQGGVEDEPGDLGATARGGVPVVRRLRRSTSCSTTCARA